MKTLFSNGLAVFATVLTSTSGYAFDASRTTSILANLNAKEKIYRSAAVESQKACEESKKDLKKSEFVKKTAGATSATLLAAGTAGVGGLAAMMIGTVGGSALIGWGGLVVAATSTVGSGAYVIMRDGKFEKIEKSQIPSGAKIVNLEDPYMDLVRVNPDLLAHREKFATPLKNYIEEKTDAPIWKQRVLNAFNLRAVDRDSAFVALDCYEQEWNTAVANDFRQRSQQLQQILNVANSSSDKSTVASRESEKPKSKSVEYRGNGAMLDFGGTTNGSFSEETSKE